MRPIQKSRVVLYLLFKNLIKGSVQDFIQHNRLGHARVICGIDLFLFWYARNIMKSVQNAVVESTSIVGTIEAMNLRNTTR
jgi:hypothetical protein